MALLTYVEREVREDDWVGEEKPAREEMRESGVSRTDRAVSPRPSVCTEPVLGGEEMGVEETGVEDTGVLVMTVVEGVD